MTNNGPATDNNEVERRSKPRIDEHFPAKVRGVDTAGKAFKAETVIDNLSAGGVYLRLARPVSPGADLFVIIRLSTSLSRELQLAEKYCVLSHGLMENLVWL